jgi:hypothetical protein
MEKEITWEELKRLMAELTTKQADFADKQADFATKQADFAASQAAGQAEVKAAQLETDRKFKETDLKFKEMVEQSKRVDRKLESLIGNWSELVESLSEVGLVEELERYGITGLNEVIQNMRIKNERRLIIKEYDRIFINTDVLVVVEVKTNLRHPDVDKHIEDLKYIFQSRVSSGIQKVYGALVFLSAHADALVYAERKGLFVLKISGDGMVKALNKEGFVPQNFVQ